MYVSLTKGQRVSFKNFLLGRQRFSFIKFFFGRNEAQNETIVISHEFLQNRLQCLHLYRYFYEVDDHRICDSIAQAEIFKDRVVSLWGTTLTASDVECISLFLTSSLNKQWEKLNLYSCYIQDKGLNILYRRLHHSRDVTINTLLLRHNGLTMQSSSMISELAVHCKVKALWITDNYTIGEDQQLYSMLTDPSNILEELYMDSTKLSSRAAIALFNALKSNNKLKVLFIDDNAITDDVSDAITRTLKMNNCLIELSIYRNPLSSEAIINIVQSLEDNNTLQLLGLPRIPHALQENIRSLQEVVNKKRESQGCQVKLEIKFYSIL